MPTLLTCLLTLFATFVTLDDREQDVVYLTDGKSREGRVVYEDSTKLILLKGSKQTEIPLDEVTEVDAVSRNLASLLERLRDAGPLPQQSANGLLELARFADQGRLPGEAQLLRYAALLVDPDNELALEELGGRVRSGEPQLKHDRSWIPTSELGAPVEEWKDRWSVSTTHYELQSNQALPDVIAAAFDAERFYQDFYAWFAKPVQIIEPVELMKLRLHADEGSFPEPGDGRRGYFDPSDRSVAVDVRGPGWGERMVHELTRQLFFMTSQFSRKARGEVPRWLQEGFGVAFSAGRSGPPGLASHDPLALAPDAIRLHANASDPYDLDRVIVFTYEDFESKDMQALKYAQSYTLLHTCLAANNGELRTRLLEFLHAAYKGRAGPSEFEELIQLDDEELAELWREHLAQLVTQI